MRLLVLGGTHHVGRAVVEAALLRGDEVTTVTRGVSGPSAVGARRCTSTAPTALLWSRRSATGPGTSCSTPGPTPLASSMTQRSCWSTGSSITSTSRAGRCTSGRCRSAPTSRRQSSRPTRERRRVGLRRREARCRDRGRAGLRRARAARPGRADPRAVRDRRPTAVVARPDRPRRSGAGAGALGPAAPVHRCSRPRRVAAGRRRPTGRRCVQRGEPARSCHDGRAARGLRRGHRERRRAGMDACRGDRGSRGVRLDRAADLGATDR